MFSQRRPVDTQSKAPNDFLWLKAKTKQQLGYGEKKRQQHTQRV